MTSLLATRAARRRGIAFTVLLVDLGHAHGVLVEPGVREVQNGVGFAFRPIQGALDEVARGVASVVAAVAEIDRLRVDNAALHAENERLAAENARLEEIRRENESLTALLQLRAGFDYKTVGRVGHRPRVVRVPPARRRSTRAPTTASRSGDVVVAAGGALAGRVTEVGPGERQGRAPDRRRVDGHRPADRATPRPARSSASSAAS